MTLVHPHHTLPCRDDLPYCPPPLRWDWTAICLVVAAAVCRYQQFRGMRAVELLLLAAQGSFANFRAVAGYADSELSLTAVSAFMIYMKVCHGPLSPLARPQSPPFPPQVLHFFAGVPRFDTLLGTMSRAGKRLASFTLCFGLLLIGFSTAFTLAFGMQVRPLSQPSHIPTRPWLWLWPWPWPWP